MHFAKNKLLNLAVFKHSLTVNADGSLPIAPFKQTIKSALEQLKTNQNQGISASELIRKYTWMIDQLTIIAWQHHIKEFGAEIEAELLAVGGYGRGELHPYSDVDLLILLKSETYDQAKPLIENFLRFMWDIGLEIGHSVRSVKDCIKEARGDITIMTNLLEARHLGGSERLFSRVDKKIRSSRSWSPDKFFSGKYEEQEQRHEQYQGTAYSLEPNIKESPGGLRDIQTILWVYNRHYGVRSFKEMNEQELINDDEYRLLIRARNILWKMRTGLHLITNRHEDRLLFDVQRQLAEEFGYQDTKANLAVEQLMKRFYRTTKDIIYLNEVLLSSYRVKNSKRFSLSSVKHIDEHFVVRNKMIELNNEQSFSESPTSIIKLFLRMLEYNVDEIHPDTIRAIRSNLDLINAKFRHSDEAKELFLKLFQYGGYGLVNALARMNAYGVLGAYIPAFGSIVGQMQHDLFHVYTVDGHTLMVLRYLRHLRTRPEEFPIASKILTGLHKPERLFLGALFHDIAKGRGGDHSILGEKDAYDFCIQHGMSEYNSKLVGWLVLSHLMMSHFSQRRDISDPDVIKEFADFVGDQEHLDNLYLLTLADIRGTSPKVWNAWKGQLLLELYQATRTVLRRGGATPINEKEHVEDDKAEALKLVTQQLGESAINPEHIHQFWDTLPNDYFIRNEPYYIAWHASSLSQNNAIDVPLVSVRFSERLQANMFFVFAPQTNRLLTQVTGAFDALELNIIEARLQLSSNGFALYSFNADVPDKESAQKDDYMRFLEKRMRALILEHDGDKPASRRSASRALKHFPIEPRISFSFDQQNYTTMEVVAQDQPGLLHNVARIVAQHNLILVSARIATFGERVEDMFFVQHHNNLPVTDQSILDDLATQIYAALNQQQNVSKAN